MHVKGSNFFIHLKTAFLGGVLKLQLFHEYATYRHTTQVSFERGNSVLEHLKEFLQHLAANNLLEEDQRLIAFATALFFVEVVT